MWAPKEERYAEGDDSYTTINAHTLDVGQEGLGLKEWVEKKLICYLDCLDEVGEDRFGEPHRRGTY